MKNKNKILVGEYYSILFPLPLSLSLFPFNVARGTGTGTQASLCSLNTPTQISWVVMTYGLRSRAGGGGGEIDARGGVEYAGEMRLHSRLCPITSLDIMRRRLVLLIGEDYTMGRIRKI